MIFIESIRALKMIRVGILNLLIVFYLILSACSEVYYEERDVALVLPPLDIKANRAFDLIESDTEVLEDVFALDETTLYEDVMESLDEGWMEENTPVDVNTDVAEKRCPEDIVLSARYLGDIRSGDTASSNLEKDCDSVKYSLIMSAGQEFSFYVRGIYLKPHIVITGPGNIRSDKTFSGDVRGLPLIFTFKAETTGEYFLVVSQSDLLRPSPFSISVSCLSNCDKLATRYPIVMVHGFSGFKNIGPVEYFYNVPPTLTSMGYDVHIAKLDPYNSTEIRGRQLKEFILEVLDKTGAKKVNIIAHSQGGLDSRYVISGLMLGDRVGALVTIATPHYGTPLADLILSDPTGAGKGALDAMLVIMGAALDSQSKADAMASLHSLSVEYVTGTFNVLYPDDERVRYYSYAGKTCRLYEDCGDTVDLEISLTYEILRSEVGDNDGIVPTAGSKWGNFLGVLPADHFDEVGQVAGVTNPNFNHIEFYKSVADLLREEGL